MASLGVLPVAPPAIVWQQPAPPAKPPLPAGPFTCDESGVIQCSVSETVTAIRSQEDIRLIAHYISLLSERNRRFYLAWREKLPAAAYEVVRRIRPFTYLPYGDMYAITDMHLILEEDRNRIVVKYPKRPESDQHSELAEDDYVVYDTDLAQFMKVIEMEIGKLKKYEKQ
jgi:hypothetical protein